MQLGESWKEARQRISQIIRKWDDKILRDGFDLEEGGRTITLAGEEGELWMHADQFLEIKRKE